MNERLTIAVMLLPMAVMARDASAQPSTFPKPVDVAFGPNGETVVATTTGILVSRGVGEDFSLICSQVIGSHPGAFSPRVAVRTDGTIAVTSYRGVRESRDGCGFELSAVIGADGLVQPDLWFSDATAGPAGQLWAATATSNNRNDVFSSVASGEPFRSVGLSSSTFWFISVAADPGGRLFSSGYRVTGGQGNSVEKLLLVDGEPASAEGLEAGPSGRIRIAWISSDGELFVVAERAKQPRGDVLYVSGDSGASFSRRLATDSAIVGVAQDQSGATWVATNSGIHWAEKKTSEFVALGGGRFGCLAADPSGVIHVCHGDAEVGGVLLSKIRIQAGAIELTALLRGKDIRAPCGDAADACGTEWQRTCQTLGADCNAPPMAPAADSIGPHDQSSEARRNWLARIPWILGGLAAAVLIVISIRRRSK